MTEIRVQLIVSVLVLLEPLQQDVFVIQDLVDTSVNVSKIIELLFYMVQGIY